jgi:hypothetical protein
MRPIGQTRVESYVSPSMHARVRGVAATLGLSVREAIVQALEMWVAEKAPVARQKMLGTTNDSKK